MKNNMKRILLTMVAAMLLVVMTVAGTLAYLTAKTNEVTNTFSVGNVTFDEGIGNGLDEADVDLYGEYVTDETARVTENEYKLMPSHTYIKDPTVHIADGSEPCYVFIDINKVTIYYMAEVKDADGNVVKDADGNVVTEKREIEAADYTTIKAQMAANGWLPLERENDADFVNEDGSGIYYYKNVVDTLETGRVNYQNGDLVIFNNFKIASDAELPDTTAELDSMKIIITAYAVQADGFQNTTVNGPDADGKYTAVAAELEYAIDAWQATFGK